MSSSGLVLPPGSPIRAGNETGSANAPVPAFASPFPSATVPFHSTSACRSNVAMRAPPNLKLQIADLLFASRDSQLHTRADQPERDPHEGHPALSLRGRHRIQDPDVP